VKGIIMNYDQAQSLVVEMLKASKLDSVEYSNEDVEAYHDRGYLMGTITTLITLFPEVENFIRNRNLMVSEINKGRA